MFDNSEKIVQDAYNRMNMSEQPWNKYQKAEVDFILENLDTTRIHRVIDFGCGNGRHALELASRGFEIIGVDYSERNIQIAQSQDQTYCARFLKGDCRYIDLQEKAELALCLYDVVGSFVNQDDNLEIIRNIHRHLQTLKMRMICQRNMQFVINGILRLKYAGCWNRLDLEL